MAGAMRKMAVYLGLVEDQDYADDYDEPVEERPRRETRSEGESRSSRGRESRPSRDNDRYGREEQSSVRVTEPRTSSVRTIREPREIRDEAYDRPYDRNVSVQTLATPGDMKISTIHPRSYNDARRIGEDYRDGVPVIMNLSEMEDGDAKRIVDFAAGLVFGLHGTIERITNKVFLLSPANVDVAAAAREQLAQDGFFNQS